jgi:hypothetical protein
MRQPAPLGGRRESRWTPQEGVHGCRNTCVQALSGTSAQQSGGALEATQGAGERITVYRGRTQQCGAGQGIVAVRHGRQYPKRLGRRASGEKVRIVEKYAPAVRSPQGFSTKSPR